MSALIWAGLHQKKTQRGSRSLFSEEPATNILHDVERIRCHVLTIHCWQNRSTGVVWAQILRNIELTGRFWFYQSAGQKSPTFRKILDWPITWVQSDWAAPEQTDFYHQHFVCEPATRAFYALFNIHFWLYWTWRSFSVQNFRGFLLFRVQRSSIFMTSDQEEWSYELLLLIWCWLFWRTNLRRLSKELGFSWTSCVSVTCEPSVLKG